MTQLVLELPPETVSRIAEEAAARGVSVEDVAAEAVQAWANADDFDWEEDEAIAAAFDETGIGVPGDEMVAWLKSIGTGNELPRPQPRKLK